MQYDPIKRSLGKVFNANPIMRKLFYRLLDLLLLRAWYIRNELRKFAAKYKSEDIEILDAGAGFGQYVYSMSKYSPKWKITAVDVKKEQVDDCNDFFNKTHESHRIHFTVADLTKYRKNEQYQMILSVDVMEHILEDVEVFKNFHASLKPGGMVLISTPSDQGGSDAHHDHDHDHDHEEGDIHGFVDEHVRDGYNISEIEDKLKTAGFSKVEARYGYGKPGNISWRLSMKYPITMLNASKIFFIIIPFYFLIAYPIAFVLNYIDVKGKHKTGTGLVVKAWK